MNADDDLPQRLRSQAADQMWTHLWFTASDAANEIDRLREQVALLRHAATIEAASLAEQTERADRLQALIDDLTDAYHALAPIHQPDVWLNTLGAVLAAGCNLIDAEEVTE